MFGEWSIMSESREIEERRVANLSRGKSAYEHDILATGDEDAGPERAPLRHQGQLDAKPG
jgi:hypothetical protein